MELPVNRFKQRLQANDIQIGLWLALGDASVAELCAAADFDWLLIDGEHGPNDVRTILAQLQAIAPYRSAPLVRACSGTAVEIKQLLDIGAQTLLVPMVQSAGQARDLVAATRYAPEGIRGIATLTRAARWTQVPDYLARAHEQLCLIVQIETAAGLEELEAIAVTPGIDALFIGPNDLAASLGHRGEPAHPEVMAAVESAIVRVRRAGKPVGIFTLDEAEAQRFIALGCTFVSVGCDATLLAGSAAALRGRFSKVSKPPGQ
jgi:4-hydroxy-2-oxoheptanedioate aldolase